MSTASSSSSSSSTHAAASDTYFRRGIQWMYGEEAYLQQLPTKDVGEKHINELLGRHPYHPYNPELPADHPCAAYNSVFFECMEADHVEGYELYQKHNACYFPYKVDLMKCLARQKRELRERREALAQGSTEKERKVTQV